MELIKLDIDGCYLIKTSKYSDERGDFVKTWNSDIYERLGLNSDFKEEYYSVSKKDVLRGMHFQKPPSEHIKISVLFRRYSGRRIR